MFPEFLCMFVTVLLLLLFLQSKRSRRSPPGPWAFPIIGNLLDIKLGGGQLATSCAWAKKYGPVFSYKLGSQKIVVLNDPKLVRELFSKRAASGRAKNPVWSEYSNHHGIAFSDGPNWEGQRTFCIRSMKTFGFGKTSSLEGRIQEELNILATFFDKNLKVPIDGNGFFLQYVTGTVWGLMAPEKDDEEKQQVIKLVGDFMRAFNVAVASGLMFFPVTRFIAPNLTGWTDFKATLAAYKEFFKKRIEKNRKQLDSSNPTGLIDQYLIEMDSTVDPTKTFYKETGYNNLLGTIYDLFTASIDTTGVTLEWAMIFLSQHINVQEKVQQELDNVVGKSRSPSLADKAMLPYTEAVIYETMRAATIGPFGIAHRILEDIEFQGYLLQKDTLVLPNMYGIHYDPSIWGNDVCDFNPNRFLNKDKTKVVRNESLIPFSVGKRKCIGENVAMDTIFLYIASFCQKYMVFPDPECPKADLSRKDGVVVSPKSFRFVVYSRDYTG